MALTYAICTLLAMRTIAVTVVRKENLAADGDAKTGSTAYDILSEVEHIVAGGVKPDEPKITTIAELTKMLDDALMATRGAAEKESHKKHAAVDKCNEDQAKAIAKITKTTKVKVDQERKAHGTCRDAEMDTHATMVKKCKKLKAWIKALDSPEKTTSDEAALVEWVGQMDTYWCPKGEQAKDLAKDCKSAKKDHVAHKAECDPLQSQFEIGFCTWRAELIDVCDAQKTCYADAVKAYSDHRQATEVLITQWKTEYVALKKISCYVDVWLSDGNAKTVDVDQLKVNCDQTCQIKKCQDLQPDKKVMEIHFKKASDESVCSLAEVEKYPGTPEFKTAEYQKYLSAKEKYLNNKWSNKEYHFVNEPTACIKTPATTEAPPPPTTSEAYETEAPTTEAPTEPPTEAPTEPPTEAPTVPPTKPAAPTPPTGYQTTQPPYKAPETTKAPTTTTEATTTTEKKTLKVKIWIDYHYHRESNGPNHANCWEVGTEEYTMSDMSYQLQGESKQVEGCVQCNNNGNCEKQGDYQVQEYVWGNREQWPMKLGWRGWEDDKGHRCSYTMSQTTWHGWGWFKVPITSNGDDCHEMKDCSVNIKKGQDGVGECHGQHHGMNVKWTFFEE